MRCVQVRIGRRDASQADPEGRLPSETASAVELKAAFADKGFSAREFVALSGAHTIGGTQSARSLMGMTAARQGVRHSVHALCVTIGFNKITWWCSAVGL